MRNDMSIRNNDKYLAQLQECCDMALQMVNANDLWGLKHTVQTMKNNYDTYMPKYVDSQLGEILAHAADCGKTQCVAYLLSVDADALWNDSNALMRAAMNGREECVKLLIRYSDPCSNAGGALAAAASSGSPECVKLLIPVSGGAFSNNIALVRAAGFGHIECVRLLLPVSNPHTRNSGALYEAINNGHLEIADVLWPVSNPLDILEFYSDGKVVDYIQQRMAEEQRERIKQTVTPSCISSVRKM